MNPMDSFAVSELINRLAWPNGRVDLVLDTDTYNEIDDQFALVYALLSKERINFQAVYAAPFHNKRSSSPGDGMEQSYREIQRILELMELRAEGLAYRGSTTWLPDGATSVASEARDDLIARARAHTGDPLYVVAIGAITNVAAALLAAPDIRDRIVVLWLAGHPLYWPDTAEFNMKGDVNASRVILDSGVPLVLFPCRLVAEMIRTTTGELRHVAGRSRIGDYLFRIFSEYETNPPLTQPGRSKVIWDLAPLAWLVNKGWVTTELCPSPILKPDVTWGQDPRRHPIRIATHIFRDGVFGDLFDKLTGTAGART
jgi:inosine-uridine nucleoside N-ribohydrolase